MVCVGNNRAALAQQQENSEIKPCADTTRSCDGHTANPPVASAPSQAQAPAPDRFSFSILAEFSGGLTVKKLKAGDKIRAQVSQDVLYHGKIIIPEDSRLVGHVTEVKRRGADD